MTTPAAFGVTAADFAARAAEQNKDPVRKSALGKDDFLAILVAQMKNQDPMDPVKGTEFATQLAQFSNVEQLININAQMQAQASAATQNQITSQTALGSSLIGRQISYVTKEIQVVEGEDPTARFSLNGDAAVVKVEVINSAGKVVYTQNLTKQAKGEHSLDLADAGLEEGKYTYKLTATSAKGDAVSTTQYGNGVVEGVSFKNGQIMLHIGSHLVPLLEINQIFSVPAAAPAKTSTTTESPTS